MTLATVTSRNGVAIRLTTERWGHITASHREINSADFRKVMDVIEHPDFILKGDTGELLAVQRMSRKKMWVVVAYTEVIQDDGFVLTAYVTTSSRWLFQREAVWTRK